MPNTPSEFQYHYTAPTEKERKEIAAIRKRYETVSSEASDTAEKYRRLCALDRRIRNRAAAFALTVGIAGCLLFGGGLALILEGGMLLGGSLLSLFGFLPMAAALPLHRLLMRQGGKKYGEEILRLSEELLQENTHE